MDSNDESGVDRLAQMTNSARRGCACWTATWFMAGSGRDVEAEFVRCQFPAHFRFDLELAADSAWFWLPHTLPSKEHFV